MKSFSGLLKFKKNNKSKFMRLILAFLMIVCSSSALAFQWESSPRIEEVLAANEVTGTFVVYNTETGYFIGYNRERAETRFIPASTYKIPHTLIGLSTGAISSVDDIFYYDGKPQPLASWEKDMNVREAIKVSCVPVYQKIARAIGLDRMSLELVKLDYGNNEIGVTVDSFWLEGPLMISPVEQARFLARLAQGSLYLPENIQADTREILLLEQNDTWALFAKTGTVARNFPNIGWWVGWVQREGKIYSFALNIEIPADKDIPNRVVIGKQCLAALGIIIVD